MATATKSQVRALPAARHSEVMSRSAWQPLGTRALRAHPSDTPQAQPRCYTFSKTGGSDGRHDMKQLVRGH